MSNLFGYFVIALILVGVLSIASAIFRANSETELLTCEVMVNDS